MMTELQAIYDSRKSFYSKALVEFSTSQVDLYSYGTLVATVYPEKHKAKIYDTYSATTLRHIKEFLQQQGFKIGNKKFLEETYM